MSNDGFPEVPEQLIFRDLATEGDYNVLARLSVDKQCVIELGSFIGGSALAMLPQIKQAGGHLYCFDHFQGNVDDPATTFDSWEVIPSVFLKRVVEFKDDVTLVVGKVTTARLFPKHMADMAFIDASHTYKDVMADIRTALHLVKPGGIICGHDYIKHYVDCDPVLMEEHSESKDGGFEGVGYGVIRAVYEVFGTPCHEGAVWWTTVADRYVLNQ